jgi:threonine/homoserine/homoserine lactone efflux protein
MENLCYLIGVGIQFLRADRRFPDWAALVLSLVLCVLAYWLATPGSSWTDREMYLAALEWWKTSLAGLVLTSMGAKALAKAGLSASHRFNPVTDSKGGNR